MKIFIVANSFWNIYNFRYSFVKKLIEKKHQIFILAPHDKYKKYLKDLNLTIIDIGLKNKQNFIIDIMILFKLFYLFFSYKPDYVFTFTIKPNIYSSIISRFFKAKVVCNISGLGSSFLVKSFKRKLTFFLYKKFLNNSHYVFFQNLYDQRFFLKLKIINKEKTDILPGSGINFNDIKYSKIVKNNTFIFIARLIEDKGIIEFLKAAQKIKKKFPDVIFKVIGEIDYENPSKITKEYLDSQIKLNFFEYNPFSSKIIDEIKNSSCVVLPSYREGKSRVLMEAMASGRPIIASDVPGCKDLIQDGKNGFISRVRNSKDLETNMIKMINLSLDDKNKMGIQGRKIIEENYHVDIVIKKYLDLIEK